MDIVTSYVVSVLAGLTVLLITEGLRRWYLSEGDTSEDEAQ